MMTTDGQHRCNAGTETVLDTGNQSVWESNKEPEARRRRHSGQLSPLVRAMDGFLCCGVGDGEGQQKAGLQDLVVKAGEDECLCEAGLC